MIHITIKLLLDKNHKRPLFLHIYFQEFSIKSCVNLYASDQYSVHLMISWMSVVHHMFLVVQ